MLFTYTTAIGLRASSVLLPTTAAARSPDVSFVLHRRTAAVVDARRGRMPPLGLGAGASNNVENDPSPSSLYSVGDDRPRIVFPGGGLFFYWQAGVIAYLQERDYDLSSNVLLSGASAGALSATLAKTGVSPYDATELALSMSDDAGVWDHPLGLQGIWGSIVRDWLDGLLPEDADGMAKDELHILITTIPSFGHDRISRFESRDDLIDANMASVHIPWFMDGNLTSNYRGKPHIDGSFLAKPTDYFAEVEYSGQPELVLDFKRDPVMTDRASEFVKVISKQAIWDILEQGKKHAGIMEQRGEFDMLPRKGWVFSMAVDPS